MHTDRLVVMDRERLQIIYRHRPPTAYMGRFGGGWQWKLGAQWSRSTLILNLLVSSIRFTRNPRGPR